MAEVPDPMVRAALFEVALFFVALPHFHPVLLTLFFLASADRKLDSFAVCKVARAIPTDRQVKSAR
jgi:hypothetical protein